MSATDSSLNPEKIFTEIKKMIKGEVFYDDLSRTLYSSAACLFQVKPLGIVQPRDKDDVSKVVQYASRNKIPLIARGGGTSRVGNELGEGIILDFSRFMNNVLEENAQEKWVRVQPGITPGALNKLLKTSKLFYPIDPSTKEHCTIGGMISNNSSGPHAIKYGATRDTALSLEIVLANGEMITTGPVAGGNAPGKTGALYQGLADVLNRYKKPLEEEKPFTIKNSSGYDLWSIQQNGAMDLTPLLVGSEGTLGIITEAKIRLCPLPGKTLGGLVYLDSLEKVGRAVQKIRELEPTMLEIIERRILDLARQQKAELRPYLPEGVEAMLFIEFEGKEEGELREKFSQVEQALKGENLAVEIKVAKDQKDMAMLGKVRAISGPILNKTKGVKKPVAFVEDGAVHPTRLPQYIKGLREIFSKYGVDAGIYGHAGDGNMHLMVFLDLRQEEEVKKMLAIAEETYKLIFSLKGTISGEHGDGRLRTYYTRRQYPKLYAAFIEIKKLFDPDNILNPGSIVGGDENPLAHFLKFMKKDESSSLSAILTSEEVQEASGVCSGCGKCRSYCPVAMKVLEEWALGRAKATLIRGYLDGTLDRAILDSPKFKEVLDSCVNCKRCLTECPSGADIPWLAVMGRAYEIEKNGEPFGQRVLASTRQLCEISSMFAPLANLANSLKPLRKGMEIAVGLDSRRTLPIFPNCTLQKKMESRPHKTSARKVVFFAGCYTNFNEPEDDGLATVEILEKNGFEVLLPDFRCCGIARLSSGALSAVEEDIKFNIRKLSEFADKNIPIIFSESSCALAVKMEYPKIVHSEEAVSVARNCYDIHDFLMKLHKKGELSLDFGSLNVKLGYHNPCHLRALGIVKEPVELLRLIPGVTVQAYSDECCGIAGTFGLKKKNYDLSLAIGERLFNEIRASDAEQLITGCGACALQIFQGTQRKAVAPVSLLAKAYRAKK
ncbi:MAG: anaerobic glycerol-3-phosphate dehydrogenase subunit C [Syntrophales bacterium]|jgi:anaerobic glycerol-3-phosphate dehydrogenase C subunit|nr:anaerobic glycerol-3-phosphate dehydrogenase subunit C [Syntrophales bacterium]